MVTSKAHCSFGCREIISTISFNLTGSKNISISIKNIFEFQSLVCQSNLEILEMSNSSLTFYKFLHICKRANKKRIVGQPRPPVHICMFILFSHRTDLDQIKSVSSKSEDPTISALSQNSYPHLAISTIVFLFLCSPCPLYGLVHKTRGVH